MSDSRTLPGPKDPLVFACVLNWNAHEETLRCIRTLIEQEYSNIRIVVVDNGSSPDSVAALESSGLAFDLILNPKNLGYTGGCNAGIRHAVERDADYVWLVNSDAVVEADTLTKLIHAAAANPSVGLLSPVIYWDSNPRKVQSCGMQVDLRDGLYEDFIDVHDAIQCMRNAPRQVIVWGTAMLIRRAVIERVGLLDERFFAYVEDVDYCVRAIGAGFEVRLVPEAGIVHGAARSRRPARAPAPHNTFYRARNHILFWTKHATGLKRLQCVSRYVRSSLRSIHRWRQYPATTDSIVDGVWCGLIGRTGGWTSDDRRLKAPAAVKMILLASSRLLSIVLPRPNWPA